MTYNKHTTRRVAWSNVTSYDTVLFLLDPESPRMHFYWSSCLTVNLRSSNQFSRTSSTIICVPIPLKCPIYRRDENWQQKIKPLFSRSCKGRVYYQDFRLLLSHWSEFKSYWLYFAYTFPAQTSYFQPLQINNPFLSKVIHKFNTETHEQLSIQHKI